jgi:hypothetical protein
MIVFLTTILHLVVYTLFLFAFLANAIITRARVYWILLVICLLQCGADITLIFWPGNFNVITIATSNFFTLLAIYTLSMVSAKLIHTWSSSVKVLIPNYHHRFIAWSIRILLVIYCLLGIMAGVALWLMTDIEHLFVAYRLWHSFLWCCAIVTFYLTILTAYIGIRKLYHIPAHIDARKKRNQLIRLFIMNLLLCLYFTLDGFGLTYNTQIQYAGYILLFIWFVIAAWPKALANYHLTPGEVTPPDSHEHSVISVQDIDTVLAQGDKQV